MAEGDSDLHVSVMVVGAARDDFAQEIIGLAGDYGVVVTRCDDIYSAVAHLATTAHQRCLVVGRLRDVARHNGVFFGMATRNGAQCCCLLDAELAESRREVLAAARAGVTIVGEAGEVKRILEQWLTSTRCHEEGPGLDGLDADDFRATETELNALLGQGTDE